MKKSDNKNCEGVIFKFKNNKLKNEQKALRRLQHFQVFLYIFLK